MARSPSAPRWGGDVLARSSHWGASVSAQAVLSHATTVSGRVVLGYAAISIGAGPAEIGLVAAAFAAPALFAAYPLGRIADRLGGASIILLGTLLNVVGLTLAIWQRTFLALLLCCCVVGIAHVACLIGQQTFVAHRATDERSDAAFGTLTASSSLGQLIGPLVATTAYEFGGGVTAGLVASAALGSLAAVSAVLLPRGGPAPPQRAPEDAPRISRDRSTLWRSLLVSGIVLAAVDLLYAFLPLWGIENGLSAVLVGVLLSLRAVAGIASRLGLGRLTERFGRKRVLVSAVAAGGLAFLLLPWVPLPVACALMVIIGVALGVPQPLTVTWLLIGVARESRGRLLGWRLTANRFAQSTIPLAVGAATGGAGADAVFVAVGALLGVGAVVSATSRIPPPGRAGEA